MTANRSLFLSKRGKGKKQIWLVVEPTPSEIYARQNWIISPNRGENNKCVQQELKPTSHLFPKANIKLLAATLIPKKNKSTRKTPQEFHPHSCPMPKKMATNFLGFSGIKGIKKFQTALPRPKPQHVQFFLALYNPTLGCGHTDPWKFRVVVTTSNSRRFGFETEKNIPGRFLEEFWSLSYCGFFCNFRIFATIAWRNVFEKTKTWDSICNFGNVTSYFGKLWAM